MIYYHQIIMVRYWIRHLGLTVRKVIPLNLFLDVVLSSYEDAIRAMRGQLKRLSRNCIWDEMEENSFSWYVWIFRRFTAEMFIAISDVFLFSWAFVCFVLVWLFILFSFIPFQGVFKISNFRVNKKIINLCSSSLPFFKKQQREMASFCIFERTWATTAIFF